MKKLHINTVICDARKVQEDVFAAYESIHINAAFLLTNPAARALLAKLPVKLNCADTLDTEDDIHLRMLNGKVTLSGADVPAGKQYLMVNGKATLRPDAIEALRQYVGIMVNGKLYCPASLASEVSSLATINGKLCVYPDDAIILNSGTKLDRTFPLRAKSALYWTEGTLFAVDETLKVATLADKGVRFAARKAIVAENLVEALVPLFSDDTEITVIPAGTRLVDDDLKLTLAALRRYGSRLYVLGDVTVDAACAGRLHEIEALTVEGDLVVPDTMEEELADIADLTYDDLTLTHGHLITGRPKAVVDAALLEAHPEGVTVVDCAKVQLDPDVLPDTIGKRLRLSSCAQVCCTRIQRAAVTSVSQDVAKIDAGEDDPENQEESADTTCINAVSYTL